MDKVMKKYIFLLCLLWASQAHTSAALFRRVARRLPINTRSLRSRITPKDRTSLKTKAVDPAPQNSAQVSNEGQSVASTPSKSHWKTAGLLTTVGGVSFAGANLYNSENFESFQTDLEEVKNEVTRKLQESKVFQPTARKKKKITANDKVYNQVETGYTKEAQEHFSNILSDQPLYTLTEKDMTLMLKHMPQEQQPETTKKWMNHKNRPKMNLRETTALAENIAFCKPCQSEMFKGYLAKDFSAFLQELTKKEKAFDKYASQETAKNSFAKASTNNQYVLNALHQLKNVTLPTIKQEFPHIKKEELEEEFFKSSPEAKELYTEISLKEIPSETQTQKNKPKQFIQKQKNNYWYGR